MMILSACRVNLGQALAYVACLLDQRKRESKRDSQLQVSENSF